MNEKQSPGTAPLSFPVLALKKMLRKKGIIAVDQFACTHLLHIKGRAASAKEFGKDDRSIMT